MKRHSAPGAWRELLGADAGGGWGASGEPPHDGNHSKGVEHKPRLLLQPQRVDGPRVFLPVFWTLSCLQLLKNLLVEFLPAFGSSQAEVVVFSERLQP